MESKNPQKRKNNPLLIIRLKYLLKSRPQNVTKN